MTFHDDNYYSPVTAEQPNLLACAGGDERTRDRMDTTTIRRWLRSRRTLGIALLTVMFVVLGTASIGSANGGAKRVEWGAHKRAKRVGTAVTPITTTTTRATSTAPTTAGSPITTAT